MGTPPDPAAGPLRGRLDEAGPARIAGWALGHGGAARLRIVDNGVALAVVTADELRPDLAALGIGDGRHGFAFLPAEPLHPTVRHVVHVQHDGDGSELANSPLVVEATEPACRGSLDTVTRRRVTGWVLDEADADGTGTVQVLVDGTAVDQAVANAYRADLLAAGIGRGWHAFEIELPAALSPALRHVVAVRRLRDGAPLPGSPVVVEAAVAFDAALEETVARAVASLETAEEQAQTLGFLLEQAERVRRQRADADGKHAERAAARRTRRRLGPGAEVADAPRRALVIDDRFPVEGRDAGSQAVLSHVRALQRLGYEVSLAASEEMDVPAAAVVPGVAWCGAPFYASVEDVLRRQAGCFDVVYLHRVGSATRYLALARGQMPQARILYSVADLHHLRLERQAAIEDRPELLALSRRTRLEECTAAWLADAVVTHSLDEQAMLQAAVPTARVHVVGWDVPERESGRGPGRAFAERRGVGLVGRYAHAPNVDAAEWLVEVVMPLVWAVEPEFHCLLVGAEMPERVLGLARPGVVVVGAVPDLGHGLFDRVRLTVAPLRYGAGVKGKVLESFAHGVPCAMTPMAAEGLPPGPGLAGLVADDAPGLAALILRLHGDERANRAATKVGQTILKRGFTAARVEAGLLAAIEGRFPAG